MPSTRDEARRERVAVCAFAIIACVAQAWAFHGMRFDDAFITYRYGQNLATGHGLTFNPGEPFLGSTSPGHMLLSALVYALAGKTLTPAWLCALGCVGWTAQALALRKLVAPALGAFGAAFVALLIAVGAARSFYWVALETNLLAALSLFALCAARDRDWNRAALLTALACLMRPDAALLALLLGGLCVRELRSAALVPLALFSALLAPWIVFATSYYGSPLPHSALAKFQRTALPEYLEHMLQMCAATVLPPVYGPGTLAILAALAVIAAGACVLIKRDRFFLLVLGYLALHALAYLVLRPIAGHDWHLYPLTLFSAVFVLAALHWLASASRARTVRVFGVLAALLFAVLCVVRTQHEALAHRDGFWTGARDTTYREIAAYLSAHVQPGERFAAIEVGTLGYHSELPAYDLGGLVTDLAHDAMLTRNVRYLVLDTQYLRNAPPETPILRVEHGGFEAFVYELPRAR